jgi:tryptophanyl-tRNA synthetase
LPHVEFTRELARRFNHMYGREPGFEDKAREAVKKLGSKKARLYEEMRTRFQQNGDKEAIEQATPCSTKSSTCRRSTASACSAILEGTGKMILAEPGACSPRRRRCPAWTARRCPSRTTTRLPARIRRVGGQEGQEHADRSNRVRRTDPGDPAVARSGNCIRSIRTMHCKEWVQHGCRTAGIGCIECKQPVIDGILREQAPMRERAQIYLDDLTLVKNIIADGCEKATAELRDVRETMGLEYH